MTITLEIGPDRVGVLTNEAGETCGEVTGLSTVGEFESLRAVLEIKVRPEKAPAAAATKKGE